MEQTPTPKAPTAGAVSPTLLAWEAPTVATHERGPRWYMTAGIVVFATAAYGIMSGSWTLALVAVLCGAMYFLLRDAKPLFSSIRISGDGVTFKNNFTRFEDIQGYWFIHTPHYSELHFARKSGGSSIVIQCGPTDPQTIRAVLAPYLSEDSDRHEGLLDIFIRLCKI